MSVEKIWVCNFCGRQTTKSDVEGFYRNDNGLLTMAQGDKKDHCKLHLCLECIDQIRDAVSPESVSREKKRIDDAKNAPWNSR